MARTVLAQVIFGRGLLLKTDKLWMGKIGSENLSTETLLLRRLEREGHS